MYNIMHGMLNAGSLVLQAALKIKQAHAAAGSPDATKPNATRFQALFLGENLYKLFVPSLANCA